MSNINNIRNYQNHTPKIAKTAWVDSSAVIIGKCTLEKNVSVWPNATLRGDVNTIQIGDKTNIQDGVVIHSTHQSALTKGSKCIVGKNVTVGHNAVLHGCIIEDECLIGMGAIVLDNAVVKKHVFIGANSLVPANKILESGYLYVGSPVKKLRALSDEEKEFFIYSAKHYVELKNSYIGSL